MSTMVALLLVLLGLMVGVGGWAGVRSYLSIVINFLLIFFFALLISWGANIWLTAACFIPLKLLTIIYLGTHKTKIADKSFLSSFSVTLIITILILILNYFAHATGVGDQAGEDLIGLSDAPGLNFGAIGVIVAIFSTLGAISEAAVAMSAGLLELRQSNTQLSISDYYQSGLNIGEDILGTAVNTILFGFFGSFLALFIWYSRLHYTFAQIINDKLFVQEFMIMIYSVIGVLLVIPLTTFIVSHIKK
ncbi:multitransmembrane protein [Lapidilactobacillus concavus DSM 17758]|uniref:Multitransmembrane protein n=1 Tax=Lapidilactobacillus concavus DSM 17758 TaxID=1423735 RepID=A0A0R1VZ10_9LACO|nr:YibE/F family protein [Lapidilactobacillus concavus]KRM08086.1 multitransmembrane protein [Lapidilactobacillus concavus DSM 17758]GEL12966.1 membrane protein [Lapidilactobacillus concavus]